MNLKHNTTECKIYLILVLFFSNFISFSQVENEKTSYESQIKFDQKSINKLLTLGVDYDKIDFNNSKDLSNLNLILKYDKRRKSNQIFAYIFSAFSLIALVGLTTIREDDVLSNIGKSIYATGAVSYGLIAIPFWIGESKYRKKRDEAVKLF